MAASNTTMDVVTVAEDQLIDGQTRVRLLTEKYMQVEVDVKVPIMRYFRSGRELIKMAQVYKDDGNYERAYIYYVRYISLFVKLLPELHPNYKSADSVERQNSKAKCNEIFPIAEKLKALLTKQFDEEYKSLCELKKRQDEENARRKASEASKMVMLEREEVMQHIQEEEDLYKKFEQAKERLANQSQKVVDHVVAPEIKNEMHISDDEISTNKTPAFDRSAKPSHLLSFHQDEGSNRMRNVIVPHLLVDKFLLLAKKNTDNNVETCGILAGKISQNCFTITHVILPKQKGTSDSCLTENEEDVFNYQTEQDLITLGWIHTHPSQNAFMSSIDLHTHCSYQLMLPEAIAIVAAPKFNQIGLFSLTHDHGLRFISKCNLPGFHPHPSEPKIYEDSKHVVFDDGKLVKLVDLR